MSTPDDETAKALREYLDAVDAYVAGRQPPALEMLIALAEVAAEMDDDEALPPLLPRNDEERPPGTAGGPPFAH